MNLKIKKIILIPVVLLLTSCEVTMTNPNTIVSEPTSTPSVAPENTTPPSAEPVKVDLTEFMQKYNASNTPEGVVKLFLTSIYNYLSADKKDLGNAMTGVLLNNPSWETQSGSLSFFRSALESSPHIFRSYAKGSSPQNNYSADMNNFEIEVTRSEEIDASTHKIFIKSSGADSPRPVTLKKTSEGLWIIHEFSSLYVGVVKPS